MTAIPDAALAALLLVVLVLAPALGVTLRRLRRSRAQETEAQRQITRMQTDHQAAMAQWVLEQEEAAFFVDVRLPARAKALEHPQVAVPGLRDPRLRGSPVEERIDQIERLLDEAVRTARSRVESAAETVVREAARSVQTLAYQVQEELAGLHEKIDDPWLAGRLFVLDELNEQQLQRLQALAVLSGTWPGLSRQDSHLPDILAAAQSRVRDSGRIQLVNLLDFPLGVEGRVVEPVVITLAELAANALYYSRGTLAVQVTLHQVASGVCIVVDDAGLGLHGDDLAFADRMLHPHYRAPASELGDPPRIGLAACGRLAREYGFTVTVRTGNSYGGATATILVPQALLVSIDPAQQPPSPSAPTPARASAEPVPPPAEGGVYPQRRSRRRGEQPPSPATTPAAAVATPEQSANSWSQFQQGTRRDTDPQGEQR
ncbi:ATP-binding protein [Streptacidiphilus sp. MAP5-52]|uniref:ATP-binding protein n=1 Tax=Streptacidiphilus sp. MAP5-52 TaxID=3156267 RepID=UPI0035196C4D